MSTTTALDLDYLPLTHLTRMTDSRGLFEYAELDKPHVEHGYCVDDVARALDFTVRESRAQQYLPGDEDEASPSVLTQLTETYLRFLEQSITSTGAIHNRMNVDGEWMDDAAGGDWWGRAMGALASTASLAPSRRLRRRAADAIVQAHQWSTPDMHSQLFAAVGAIELFRTGVTYLERTAAHIINRAATMIGPDVSTTWPWPEPRLRYANAVIPHVLIAAGMEVADAAMVRRGLDKLNFLLDLQTHNGKLSLVGNEGRGPDDSSPQYDQQPIEAVTLAQACAFAYYATGDERYRDGVALAWQWFVGNNDAAVEMIDPHNGSGYDGLSPGGRNDNRGAESTLAALTTHQLVRRLGLQTSPA